MSSDLPVPASVTTQDEAIAADDAAQSVDDRWSRVRPILRTVAVALSFLVLSFLVYWPVAPLDQHHIIDCSCGDPIQEVWFLDWTRFAFVNGHNPFITHYMNVPTGANLALNTSFPLLGVLSMPITATLGPIASYNILLRLALAASGFSMYAVLRRYTRWLPAAYFGGLLFGFSPYMIGHAHRHLFLTFLPLVPLFIPLIDAWLVSARGNPWRWGALIGLLAAAEFLISPEILLTVVIFAVIALVVIAFSRPNLVRDRLGRLWRGALAELGVFVVLAGYPAWLLVAGPFRPVGAIHSPKSLGIFNGDLLAPVVGTSGQVLTPSRIARAGDRFAAASIVENGFYLGAALVVLLLFLAVRARKSLLLRVGAGIALVAFVLGLGSTLSVHSKPVLKHLPFELFTKLPLLENVEPARLSLFVQLGAALVLAVGLDVVRASGWRRRRAEAPVDGAGATEPVPRAKSNRVRQSMRPAALLAMAGVSLAFLIPTVPLKTGLARVPSFFTTSAVRQIPQGAVVLTFPYDRSPHNDPMLWQTASHMRFRIFGGEAFVPNAHNVSTFTIAPPSPPDIHAVLLANSTGHPNPPPVTKASVAAVRAFCSAYGVDVALVDPRAKYGDLVTTIFTRALGGPPRIEGDVYVWLHVRATLPRN